MFIKQSNNIWLQNLNTDWKILKNIKKMLNIIMIKFEMFKSIRR